MMKFPRGFSHSGCFQQPLFSAVPCIPIPNHGVINTTESPAGGNGPFPYFFRVCFFRLDSWSPQRGPARRTPGRVSPTEGGLALIERRAVVGTRQRVDPGGTRLSRAWEGRSSKATDAELIQVFTFVILQ